MPIPAPINGRGRIGWELAGVPRQFRGDSSLIGTLPLRVLGPRLSHVAMGNRPDVKTAPAPIVALDVTLLAEQLAIALARVPFRQPFAGGSSPLSNLGASVTREVIRSLMGYASALRIPEWRSMELVLDEICQWVMPPVVAALEVESFPTQLGGVPGILYVPTRNPPVGVVLYLHGGGYIGTSPTMYAFFTARVCRTTDCAVFVADYRLAPEFPFPAGAEDASAAYRELRALGIPDERIFLGGDSGGGGLANTILLSCPAHVEPLRPAGLLLFSPEVDLRLDEPSVFENADRDILPWNIPTTSYLHGVDAGDYSVSPLTADLRGFPPPVSHGAATRCSVIPSAVTSSVCGPPVSGPRLRSTPACSTCSRS